MGAKNGQRTSELERRRLRVVSREQLLALGWTDRAIKHAVASGRLYPMWPGIYSVGTAQLSPLEIWGGAVLACGPGAAASHGTSAAILGIWARPPRKIHVSVPARKHPRGKGIVVHRRAAMEVAEHRGIPVTSPASTIVDIAPPLPPAELEQAINRADVLGLATVPRLRAALEKMSRRPGGLPLPLTRQWVNGFEVDFYWPELGLVVETDGGTYHRTPAQQTADRRRDQAHTASGLTNFRFTHGQIRYEPGHVEQILRLTYMSSIVSASSPTSRNCV
jgi:very-short-patch-repair endonuclease